MLLVLDGVFEACYPLEFAPRKTNETPRNGLDLYRWELSRQHLLAASVLNWRIAGAELP